MYNRIAIIGTHSTGKTTLAKALSSVLDIPVVEECARKHDIKHASLEEYIQIQENILAEQITAESKHRDFISDRSTTDNLAYWVHSCARRVDACANRAYIKNAIDNTKNYTNIFLLIPEFYPRDDGFRDTNIIYQLQIAETINTILYLYQIPHNILSGSVNERLQQALKILKHQ